MALTPNMLHVLRLIVRRDDAYAEGDKSFSPIDHTHLSPDDWAVALGSCQRERFLTNGNQLTDRARRVLASYGLQSEREGARSVGNDIPNDAQEGTIALLSATFQTDYDVYTSGRGRQGNCRVEFIWRTKYPVKLASGNTRVMELIKAFELAPDGAICGQ